MAVVLEFELDGKKISRELGVVSDGVKSLKKPLDEIGGELLKTFDMNFASRGALYGGWAERKVAKPWPLLEKTGRMRHAFRKRAHDDYVILDNTVPYFPYHQSTAPRSVIPRRVMMSLRRQDVSMVQKTIQRYLIEILRKRGER